MVFAMIFWAAGWPALKIVSEDVSFEVVTFWRFAIMFLAFIPILFWVRRPLVWGYKAVSIVVVNAILNILFMVFAFFGVYYGTASGGGVIVTTLSPLMTFALGALFLGRTIGRWQAIGLAIGLAGGMVMLQLYGDLSDFFALGNGYFLAGALTWALVTLLSQHAHAHLHPIHYSFLIALVGVVVMSFFTTPSDVMVVFEQDGRFWSALLFLAIFGQTVATTIYYIVAGRMGAQYVSGYMFLVPFFALLFSVIFLDEALTWPIVIGGVLTMVAVYMLSKK
ncbi:MAG: hypothetical protein KU37_10860 [Sulfuricurvum sp. PC08-66]|nr:MAG: hypothetical protein KU37_10860 [Sulfuricurvum sp. PC08-66]